MVLGSTVKWRGIPDDFIATRIDGQLTLDLGLSNSVSGVLNGQSSLFVMREQSVFSDVLAQQMNSATANITASGNAEQIKAAETTLSAGLKTAIVDFEGTTIDRVFWLTSDGLGSFQDSLADLTEAKVILQLKYLP